MKRSVHGSGGVIPTGQVHSGPSPRYEVGLGGGEAERRRTRGSGGTGQPVDGGPGGRDEAGQPVDGPDGVRRRRRGSILEEAIYAAVLGELADRGFGRLTFEGVADRAGTGKAALYRRWPSKVEMVVDTVTHVLPDLAAAPPTGNLRDDLLACLGSMADGLAGPVGTCLRGLIGDVHQHRELAAALHQRVFLPRQAVLWAIYRDGVVRGDVRPDALVAECVNAGPALLRQQYLESGLPIDPASVVAIVDHVLLPMVRPVPALVAVT